MGKPRLEKMRHVPANSQHPYVFLHIPKTGGTTLSAIVKRNVSDRDLSTHWVSPSATELYRARHKRVIFGHLFYGLHTQLGTACTYLTILRDPVERVLSHYFYHRRTPADPFHHLARDLSIERWVEAFVDGQSLQTQIVGGRRGVPTAEDLARATSNLRTFAVVGLLERFDETVDRIGKLLGFDTLEYEILKAAPDRPRREDLSAGALAAILEHNIADQVLYEEGQKLFDSPDSLEQPSRDGPALPLAVGQRLENRSPVATLSVIEVPLRLASRLPLRLAVKPDRDVFISVEIATRGVWEEYNTNLLQALLADGEVVLDLGAHIGYFTVVAADLVGERGRVLAFEPEPENASICAHNIRLNGFERFARVFPSAVGARSARGKLYRATHNQGAHQLDRPYRDGHDLSGTDIEVHSLDGMLSGEPSLDEVHFVKMDVQGYETKALLGMRDLIGRNREHLLMLAEFSPSLLQPFDHEGEGLERFYDVLEAEVESIHVVARTPRSEVGAGLVTAVSSADLREIGVHLTNQSERDGEDRCVDLLLAFSVRGRDRVIARAGQTGAGRPRTT